MICPFCKEEIKDGAIKCKHCKTDLKAQPVPKNEIEKESIKQKRNEPIPADKIIANQNKIVEKNIAESNVSSGSHPISNVNKKKNERVIVLLVLLIPAVFLGFLLKNYFKELSNEFDKTINYANEGALLQSKLTIAQMEVNKRVYEILNKDPTYIEQQKRLEEAPTEINNENVNQNQKNENSGAVGIENLKDSQNESADKLEEQSALANIAKNDENDSVRNIAVSKLTDQAVLEYVAKNDTVLFVRCEALRNSNFTDLVVLEDIAQNDKNEFVRELAQNRIEELKKAQNSKAQKYNK